MFVALGHNNYGCSSNSCGSCYCLSKSSVEQKSAESGTQSTLGETDFRTLENRFIVGLVNYTAVIETVLDGWVQKYRCQATIGVLCQALQNNSERLASGKFS
jgi:hypothetical protein